jgi:hypothetical protein
MNREEEVYVILGEQDNLSLLSIRNPQDGSNVSSGLRGYDSCRNGRPV